MTPDIDILNLAQGQIQKQSKMSMSDKTQNLTKNILQHNVTKQKLLKNNIQLHKTAYR